MPGGRLHSRSLVGSVKGERVDERFRLEEPIATGASATVWRAADLAEARTVAVKLAQIPCDEREAHRFHGAADLAAAVLHMPQLVRVYTHGTWRGRPYVVMEHVEGPTLARELLACGRLEERRAVRVVADLAVGLDALHGAGLVHRDLKPANVMLVGPRARAKIVDLGLMKRARADGDTRSGDFLGTTEYASPEQILDAKRADAASDVWALGVIAYECLTGRRPFEAPQLDERLRRILRGGPDSLGDDELDAFFARALAVERRERFAAAGSLAAAFKLVARRAGALRPRGSTIASSSS